MNRPSWDQYFMEIAEKVATRSTCIRRQIGAVAVFDKQILCTGYNGAPSGTKHCIDIGCIRETENIESGTMHEKCRAIHAEQNLIVQAALKGISLEGCDIYCLTQPCVICTKLIIGIKPNKLIYKESYPDEDSLAFLHEVGRRLEFSKNEYTIWEFN